MNRFFCNPYVFYAFSWIVVFGTYLLGWSDKYPKLSVDLVFFLLFTCLMALLIATHLHKSKSVVFVKLSNPLSYLKWIYKMIKLVYSLMAIDFIYCGSIPIVDYLLGRISNSGQYLDFGMPVVHVLVLNGLFFLFYFTLYCHFSSNFDRAFLKPLIIIFLGPLLFMSRGSLLYMIFALFYLFLMTSLNAIKTLVFLAPCSIIILYFFGLFGNFRTNDPEGFWIKHWGGASKTFEECNIPSEFLWGYLYISSPLGDLQNAVKYKTTFNNNYCGPTSLFANQILPKFVGKRLEVPAPNDKAKYFVDPTMVVGTTYFEPYLIWGWKGVFVVFLVLFSVPLWMLKHIPKGSIVRVPLYIVLTNLLFFSIFDNMLIYMGLFPQLLIIYFLRNFKINV